MGPVKISNRTFAFDSGQLLDELDCVLCGGSLDFTYEDGYERNPTWVASCCDYRYELGVASVRARMERGRE